MDDSRDEAWMERACTLSHSLEQTLRHMRHGDLGPDPRFQELVALLAEGSDDRQRVRLLAHPADPMRCATLAAMARAGDRSHAQVASMLDRVGYFALHFALDYLGEGADAGLADAALFGRVLLRTPAYMAEWPSLRAQFFDCLRRLHAAGLAPALSDVDARLDWTLEDRRDALAEFDVAPVLGFVAQLEQVDRERRLAAIGADFAYIPTMCRRMGEFHALLTAPTRPCLVLAGDAGTGRGSLARSGMRTLAAEGWTVVEASPRELLAQLQHVHPIEERIATLASGLSGERQVWHATCWYQMLDPPSEDCHAPLLELLWPYLQSGLLQIVGSASWHNLARAGEDLPHFSSVFRTVELVALNPRETRSLAQDWVLRHSNRLGMQVIDEPTLARALALAENCSRHAEPGRSLGLLQDALEQALATPTPSLPLVHEAILRTLERRSGLTPELLEAVCSSGPPNPIP